MIAILDYGAGNLGSVAKAFQHIGAQVEVTADPEVADRADGVVLPGVGAFAACMRGLERARLVEAARLAALGDRPFLGICVGMQMLFERSDEFGSSEGLGALDGAVVRFDAGLTEGGAPIKIPHIGWNALQVVEGSSLLAGIPSGEQAYFVHSYYAQPKDEGVISARCEYGLSFSAAIERGRLHATQFHPEKSGDVGLEILRNFTRLCS